MMNDFKQFVPSKICLSCDGCCRFQEAKSQWQPKITEEEIYAFGNDKDKIFHQDTIADDDRIATVPCHNGFMCTFFNPETHACSIYHNRPFECQLYPFILRKNKDTYALYVHLSCPYIQENEENKKFDEYVEFLESFFKRKDVAYFLKNHRNIFNDYNNAEEEMKYLFRIDV